MKQLENDNRTPAGLTIIIAVMMLIGAMASADSIRLHDQAATESGDILLRDIAELRGDGAESFGDLVIANFEGEHTGRSIRLADVRRKLNEHCKVNWARTSLTGHMTCQVTRLVAAPEPVVNEDRAPVISNHHEAVTTKTAMTIRDRVIAQIEKIAGVSKDELEINFSDRDVETLNTPAFLDRWEVRPVTRSTLGRVPFEIVQYDANDAVANRYRVTAEVAKPAEVVVVRRDIQRGRIIAPGDVALQSVKLRDDRSEAMVALDEVIGMMAAQRIKADSPVTTKLIEPPVLVRRGEPVIVRAFSGPLVVRISGKASNDGGLGEIISVRSKHTSETIPVRVTGRGECVVIDSQMAAKGTK